MTSNIGSEYISQMAPLGFLGEKERKTYRSLKEKVREALKEYFRPEFLNRVDETIIFNYLGRKEIEKIVDLELDKVIERLKKRRIKIKFIKSAKELLAEKGFDPNFGARPLKRVIQKLVLDSLALHIVAGDIKEGQRVVVGAKKGAIVFEDLSKRTKAKEQKLASVS